MSHRWDCPTEWEARRDGERAAERGYGRGNNPYKEDFFNRSHCEEAERAWNRGHRYAEERREEEQAAERAAERRAAERRAYERQQEEEYQRRQEEEYCAQQQEPPQEPPIEEKP